ncbi:LysR substrate-binding domain-containing protein [Paraburkholderia silviterrae]|uniref:LysR family transcriptional regulator n=1 Tax=Paraburkholderia silviterrae TaxID=2528715 RepID=A0A4R5M5R3_9BURK|nr:LysR substrate-binding domain-containing protein [Paraburkholderia silviterrae]TDG21302.1 LysR family transcriptional regulator [Paraburkholderia silviterrae]
MEHVISDIPWARRLKLRHLEVFLLLTSYGSLTAAATAMHMTQPAVSHWLKDLEDLVGTQLLVRGRQMRLTETGEALRRHAERMLGDVRRTNEELEAIRTGKAGQLHVGTVLAAAPVLLPKAIARLQRETTRVTVSVREDTFDQLLEQLEKHELDVIVGRLSDRTLRLGLPCEILVEDPICVVCGPQHPLVSRPAPSWHDASSFPWIMPAAGTPMRVRLEAAFAEHDLPVPEPAVESVSILANQMLFREGPYLGIVAASVARHFQALGLMAVIALPTIVRGAPVGILWRQHKPNAVTQRLLAVLREEAKAILHGGLMDQAL